MPRHSLVGNVANASSLDGKGFFVGSSFQGTVPVSNTTNGSGKLFLGFNDGSVFCDRSGYDAWGFGGGQSRFVHCYDYYQLVNWLESANVPNKS